MYGFVIGLFIIIMMIITVSISSIVKMDENQLPALFEMISWSSAVMHNGIMLCQYLMFSVNANCYYKICSNCHMKCDHFCQYLAVKRMNV